MLQYNSTTGEIRLDEHFEGYGYSGHGEGRNNPELEHVRKVGPIPRGDYLISKWFDDIGGKGPIVFNLTPIEHNAHGRTGFMIHGDNVNHDASLGCIIAGRLIRLAIKNDDETRLRVV